MSILFLSFHCSYFNSMVEISHNGIYCTMTKDEEGVRKVPTAMQFTLYACTFDRESYCHEISVCGIEVFVILLNVMQL